MAALVAHLAGSNVAAEDRSTHGGMTAAGTMRGTTIWKILHGRVRTKGRGPAVSAEGQTVRTRKMIRELRRLGYRIGLWSISASIARGSRP